MFGIGPMELVVIVVVALLIFGPQKLPELARTLGKGLAEFRRASNDLRQSLALDELQNDLRKTMNDATHLPPVRPAQAGDSLPPGTGATAPAQAPPAATPPWKSHPGELPEGHDFDHHPGNHPDHPPDHRDAAPDDAAPAATARPADSPLGSVPVGGADPTTDPRRG